MTDEPQAERERLTPAAFLESRIEALEVLMVDVWAERLAPLSKRELAMWCSVMQERARDATCQPHVIAEDAADRALKTRVRLAALNDLLARIRGVSSAYRSTNEAVDRLHVGGKG